MSIVNLFPKDFRKINSLAEEISPLTLVHGHAYHEARLLFNFTKEEYQLQAQVREAGSTFTISIDCETGSYYCNCSELKPCKHIAGLVLWAQEQNETLEFKIQGERKNKSQGKCDLVFEINPETYKARPLIKYDDKTPTPFLLPFKDEKDIHLLKNDWYISWEEFLNQNDSFKINFQNNAEVGFPLQKIVAYFHREDQPTTIYYTPKHEIIHFGGYVKLNAIICDKELSIRYNSKTKYELLFYYFDPLNKYYKELNLNHRMEENINRMDLKSIYSEYKLEDIPLAIEHALFPKKEEMTKREKILQPILDLETNKHLKLIKYTKAKNLTQNVFYLLKPMPRINQTLLFKERKGNYTSIEQVYQNYEKFKYFLEPNLKSFIDSAVTIGPRLALSMFIDTNSKKFKIKGRVELVYSNKEEFLDPKYWEKNPHTVGFDELYTFVPEKTQQANWIRDFLTFSENGKLVKRNLLAENKLLDKLKIPFPFKKKDGSFSFSTHFLKKFSKEYLPILKEQNIILRLHENLFSYLEKSKHKKTAYIDITSSSNLSWFTGSIKIEGMSFKDTKAIINAYYNKQEFVKLSNATWAFTNAFNLEKIFNMLQKVGVDIKKETSPNTSQDDLSGTFLKGNLYNILNLKDQVELRLDENAKKIQKTFQQNLSKEYIPSFHLSLNMENVLRTYQKEGVHFFHSLFSLQVGGILADDMGLGKTIQTLAFIESIYLKNSKTIFLIIGPLAALNVWENEAKKFTPTIPFQIWHGSKMIHTDDLIERGIIFITYTTLIKNVNLISKRVFTSIFLDEAQNIKNIKTITAKSVRMLNTSCFFCLTGTPIQNHLGELWALMELCFPGLLGSYKNFKEIYEIEREISIPENLLKRIQPFILRRKKQDVLKELPSKNEILISLPFHKTQALIYEKTRRKALEVLQNSDSEYLPQMLSYLMKLRRICCHPDLQTSKNPDFTISSKFLYLKENLQKIKENSTGVLIFSQFTDVLDMVAELLAGENQMFFYLNGSTALSKRQIMVKEFQAGERHFFLISLKAGGTSLTLHRADTIIHLDPWWNPASEDQATDRAHRLGQKRQVFVYKLIIQKSLEEKVLLLQNRKKKLFDTLFNHTMIRNEFITREEIAEILKEG